jgi:hypothetical protein
MDLRAKKYGIGTHPGKTSCPFLKVYLVKSYKKKEKYILAWNCVCVEVPRCLGPAQDVPSPLLCRPQGTNTYFNDAKVNSYVESRVDLDTVLKGLSSYTKFLKNISPVSPSFGR